MTFREIVIDNERRPLTFSEFTLKEFEKDREGNWIDEIQTGTAIPSTPCAMP